MTEFKASFLNDRRARTRNFGVLNNASNIENDKCWSKVLLVNSRTEMNTLLNALTLSVTKSISCGNAWTDTLCTEDTRKLGYILSVRMQGTFVLNVVDQRLLQREVNSLFQVGNSNNSTE